MDKLNPARRSENMRRIKSKGTNPEIAVRRLAHSLGYRFRLHRKDLPGKPDLVFPRYKKIVLVHGCFWHFHKDCREGRVPGTRIDYWQPKLEKNVARDARNQLLLRKAGWNVLVVWECEIPNLKAVETKLKQFLSFNL